ncbi:MAG TPA: MetQ/NlpA family ABC transporter substrate-binding protein [Syntrophorhabdaceae bacterium]|nr:MetQ/NlpA family ABC transporter substrate-binding protein [Syntrophorhabdaceae bacterium]
MNSIKRLGILVIVCVLALPVGGNSREDTKMTALPVAIKFGTIPVLQSLPLFVASEKGFFKEQGLNVEIVLFNSALEKDIALTSGQIIGYFGDLMTPMVLQANGAGVRMVAVNFNTTGDRRMFAILASPKAKDKTLAELARAGIATSSNSIADYLIVRLLERRKISKDAINLVDVKNIPIRLQMLLSGQVPAALMPEPLATLAETKGAKALIDDRGQGLSATVLAFNERFLNGNPQAVKAFHKALNRASEYINKNPDEVRAIMNRDCKMPEPLQGSFPIPRFPKLAIPAADQVMDVYRWLSEKQIITKNMTYKDMVADGFLP